MNLEASYRQCERITRTRAQNLYYGIRLLPPEKRRAVSAVYAFARRVDDIGDGELEDEEKLRRLRDARAALAEMSVSSEDPVMTALADTRDRFGLGMGSLLDLVSGVETDVTGHGFQTFDDLVAYCRLVAGSIGRLCVGIFGPADSDRADSFADDLGVAMQLTNILRDVREDLGRGRIYLPADDRRRFGVDGDVSGRPEATVDVIRHEAALNREWFERGLRLLPLLDRRSASCVAAMSGIYRRILDRIEQRPEIVLQRRLALPAREKAWVAARSLLLAR